MEGIFQKPIVLFLLCLTTLNAETQDKWSVVYPDSVSSKRIVSLYRSGSTIFVGTSQGIDLFEKEKPFEYSPPFISKLGEVVAITKDMNDRLWCIIAGRLYVNFSDKWIRCTLIGLDSLGEVKSFAVGPRDLTIGTNRGSIYSLNVKAPIKLDTLEVIGTLLLDSLLTSGDSLVLDSLLENALTVEVHELPLTWKTDVISDIQYWRGGFYFLATPKGFLLFNSEKPGQKPKEIGREVTADLQIGICAAKESDSSIWLAGTGCVGRINPLEPKQKPEILEIPSVKAITIDSSSHRWLICSEALFEVYPETLVFLKHSLPENLMEWKLNTVLPLSGDSILLGTDKGILLFQPARPQLSLENIKIEPKRDSKDNVILNFEIINADAYPYIECQWFGEGITRSDITLKPLKTQRINLGNLEPGKNQITILIRRPFDNEKPTEDSLSVLVPRRHHKTPPSLWVILILVFTIVILSFVIFFVYQKKKREVKELRHAKSLLRGNPYIAGAPIRDAKNFFGRKQILEEVLAGIHSNSFLIHGERRIGKTSLLYQIRNRIRASADDEYEIIPVMVSLEKFESEIKSSKTHKPYLRLSTRFYTNLAHVIAPKVYKKKEYSKMLKRTYPYSKFEEFSESLFKYLQDKHKGKTVRVILLIDEGDEMNNYGSDFHKQFRGLFQSSYAEVFNIVLTLKEFSPEWRHVTSPWYNFFNAIPLPHMTEEETYILIQEYVQGGVKYRRKALNLIWEITHGHPYEIQRLCSKIFNLLGDKVYVNRKDVVHAANELYNKHGALDEKSI